MGTLHSNLDVILTKMDTGRCSPTVSTHPESCVQPVSLDSDPLLDQTKQSEN